MKDQLQRPLVVGGVILALGIWGLEILNQALGEWSIYALFAGTIGAIGWWLQKSAGPTATLPVTPKTVDFAIVQQTLSETGQVIAQLETEVATPAEPAAIAVKPQVPLFQSQMVQIRQELRRQDLRLILVGGKGSGKTALTEQLKDWAQRGSQTILLWEAPSFSGETAAGLAAETIALRQAMMADLAVFLVTGDLTASELQTVQRLVAGKRTLLVFNKQDQYSPAERETLLNQLRERVRGILPAEDVVAISTVPNPIKVRQHQTDGSTKEWLEEQPPAIETLTQRLDQILQQESQQLVLASSYTSAVALKTQVKAALNEVRRARALPVVEQFQWVAAATAFASPVPTLDVLATAAINTQMILDLGAIYQQKFSLQQAQKIATTLGSLMLKLGLVELSTQAVSSLLKTNAFTYVAGGCFQGISAAYLTRVAGLSLIEYFHSQEPNLTPTEAPPLMVERLSQILSAVFQRNQQLAFLQAFVTQTIDRLTPAYGAVGTGGIPITYPVGESVPIPPIQKSQVLDENGSGVPLVLPSLDSTTLPST